MYTASTSLPKDRESVFWFNVLEVPPKPVLINSVRDGLCFLTPNIQQLYAS
ncbi:fimbria/pilus periplasmic chaperone [Escherichia coli]|uniref:fimbria/pilus periplasmic chaperone n=1 Tax=Escherichia coli TaxID=562 RepID=UPI00385609D9